MTDENVRLLCAIVAACGRPLGHRGQHAGWRTMLPEQARLRGDTIGNNVTAREMEIIRAYARLGDQQAVATYVALSVQTVKNHMSHIYAKLGVGSWAEAMFVLGWIRIPTDDEVQAHSFGTRFAMLQTEIDAMVLEAREIANGLEALESGIVT